MGSLCQDRNMICKQRPCLQIVIFAFLAIASNNGESVEHGASEVQGVSEKDQAVEDILENQDDNIDEELLDDPDQNIEVAPEFDQTEEDQTPEGEQFNKNEVEEVVDQTDEELTQEFLEDLYYNKDVEPGRPNFKRTL